MDREETVIISEDDLDPGPPEKSYRNHHRTMLAMMSVVVVMAFMLDLSGRDRVNLRGLSQHPLPHSCLSRSMFGYNCPGCGLTRSFISLAQGRLRESLAFHRVGWLLAIAVLVQFPYRITRLRKPPAAPPAWTKWFSALLIIALIGNWLLLNVGI